MSYQIPCSNTKINKIMTSEQFNQVVEAILAGKYSWACVLILRFAGYNPLHYIPYRTYNRLLKENCQIGRQGGNKPDSLNTENQSTTTEPDDIASQKCSSKITDLPYLETVREHHASIRGGSLYQPLESSSFKIERLSSKSMF